MTGILIPVFQNSSILVVFLYIWTYGMTMFAFGVLIGSFFSSGKTAGIVGIMAFAGSSFLTFVVGDPQISEGVRTVSSFFPSVGVQLAGTILLEFESSGFSVNFHNMNQEYENFRFATNIWMN